jgi:hypothetical protein
MMKAPAHFLVMLAIGCNVPSADEKRGGELAWKLLSEWDAKRCRVASGLPSEPEAVTMFIEIEMEVDTSRNAKIRYDAIGPTVAEQGYDFFGPEFMERYDEVLIHVLVSQDTLVRKFAVSDLARLKEFRYPVKQFFNALHERKFTWIRRVMSHDHFQDAEVDRLVASFTMQDSLWGNFNGLTPMNVEFFEPDGAASSAVLFTEFMWNGEENVALYEFTVDPETKLITSFRVRPS